MEAFYGDNRLLAIPFIAVCLMQVFWFLVKGRREQDSKRSSGLTDLIVCVCVAFTVGTLLHQYPGTKVPVSTDSSVFLYIGKQMHAGKIPYVDLFDHKGPALYVIQYLGYLIWPGSAAGGVWILETVSYAVTAWLMLKTAAIAEEDYRSKYLALIMVLIACGFKMYSGGNFTEEHALPWIALSAYIFFLYFKTGKYTRFQIIALGFSCMVVLLLQGNLITVWVAFIPVILFLLIREKRYLEVGRCILDFTVGMFAAFLPVLIWALHDHFLKAMWEVYILFNFEYSENMAPGLLGYLDLTRDTLARIWPALVALVVALIREPKNKFQWLNLWFLMVSIVLTQVSGRASPYYRLVLFPAVMLPFVGFFDGLWRLYGRKRVQRRNDAVVILSCLLLVAAAAGHRYLSNRNNTEEDIVVRYLKEQTTEDDRVLIVGNYAWPYVAADRTTDNRFFFQWPPIQVSDELYAEFLEELEIHPSNVVVLPENENSKLQIPGEGKIDRALELLEQMGYQREQYDGFRVYLAPSN
ncbi:MAG: hypothetical protein IJV40_13160 [Oscillospiraceae bacterium]|nr:hypothetical protein [Oscillospiraceae bacterium]